MIQIPLFPRLETERIFVRPFIRSDREGFIYFMTSEIATRFLLLSDDQKTAQGAGKLFDLILSSYHSTTPVHSYAIARKDNNIFIGSCGITPLDQENIYECYYSLIPEFWGYGLAGEAVAALLDYCFTNTSIQEVRAYMTPENQHSAQVALSVGMKKTGMQNHPLVNYPGSVYSITKKIH
jgi:[ribosomal protein S5]-alanine N-acetyltransferase